jgi:hypothetical protein
MNLNISFNLLGVVIDEPNLWYPVNTTYVAPSLPSCLLAFIINYNSFEIIAKVTANFCWVSLRILLEVLASFTVPITIRKAIRID